MKIKLIYTITISFKQLYYYIECIIIKIICKFYNILPILLLICSLQILDEDADNPDVNPT